MDGTLLQTKIDAGLAKAAPRIGQPFAQFRPTGPVGPLAAANQIATLTAWFGPDSPQPTRPDPYGKPVRWPVLDRSQIQVGDYFTGTSGTFFIASAQPLRAVQAVQCNRTLTVSRMETATGIGALDYNSDIAASETVIMGAWPAAMLVMSKAEQGALKLPGDVRQSWWSVLMPAWPGAGLIHDDIVTDETGMRYALVGVELTDMGWRLTAQQNAA